MHGLVSPLQGCSSVPEAALAAGSIPAIDDRRCFGRDVLGVHGYQGRLVALIAVDAPANAPLGRHGHHEVSAAGLPVKAVAAGLRPAAHRLFCKWAK
jgi:hypothetical protein